MQFIDLKKQYDMIQVNIEARFQDIMTNTRFIMGQEVRELESVLSDYTGVKYCFTCANGTDALQIALMTMNVKSGDAVFVPSFTFYATAEVVSLLGAVPIFIDVKAESFNMDPDKLEEAIRNVLREGKWNPKAVIPVDLFGLPADYLKINEIADKYGIMVVEDGAQGFGGSINGKKACSFGHISTTSFFPAKPLGCYGDGGAIFTDDEASAAIIDSIRVHGKGNDKYQNVRVGLNSRLDTLQAAVLLEKLKIFDQELIARNRVANRYREGLSDLLVTPRVENSNRCEFNSSWAQYSVLTKSEEQRTSLMTGLKERRIPAMIYYQVPLHKQLVYSKNDIKTDYCDMQISENISKRIFSLPMHPYLEDEEVEYIIRTVKELSK